MKKLLSLMAMLTLTFTTLGCGGSANLPPGEEPDAQAGETEQQLEASGMSEQDYEEAMKKEMQGGN